MATTASRVRREVSDFVVALLEAELALTGQTAIERPTGKSVLVTWPGSGASPSWTRGGVPFASLEEYRAYLETATYSSILLDGSILQFSFLVRDGSIVRHRLAFVPCPLMIKRGELEPDEDLLAQFDLLAETELRTRLRSRSTLRFDLDLDSAGPEHAASHLTLLHEECRWPVFGPLSLGHFFRFVFQRFYPDAWEAHTFLREWPLRWENRTLTVSDEEVLHVDCRQQAGTADGTDG